jgi:hypothetical protein
LSCGVAQEATEVLAIETAQKQQSPKPFAFPGSK